LESTPRGNDLSLPRLEGVKGGRNHEKRGRQDPELRYSRANESGPALGKVQNMGG